MGVNISTWILRIHSWDARSIHMYKTNPWYAKIITVLVKHWTIPNKKHRFSHDQWFHHLRFWLFISETGFLLLPRKFHCIDLNGWLVMWEWGDITNPPVKSQWSDMWSDANKSNQGLIGANGWRFPSAWDHFSGQNPWNNCTKDLYHQVSHHIFLKRKALNQQKHIKWWIWSLKTPQICVLAPTPPTRNPLTFPSSAGISESLTGQNQYHWGS